MTVQSIGESFALFCSKNELDSIVKNTDDVDAELAVTLLRFAMPEVSDWSNARVEVYCGTDEIMLFARLCGDEPLLFSFDELESLLSGISLCHCEPSSLYLSGSQYILAVWPWNNECCTGIAEFGRMLSLPSGAYLHIQEHASQLISCNAMSRLREIFSL